MIALLIRHGHTEAVGRWLAGRRPGVALTKAGRHDAERIAEALRWAPIAGVYSSPLERAVDTATPLARDRGLAVTTRDALTDMDFGGWTGKQLADLVADSAWEGFNRDRPRACAPGGESLCSVQTRVVGELVCLSRRHGGEMIAVVTHAEPIRCAIAAFNRSSLDEVSGIDIAPGHVSAVGVGPHLRCVLAVNLAPELAMV